MHDPLVVAHEIRRPWPCRDGRRAPRPGMPRWQIRYSWATWRTLWKPSTYRAFWILAGQRFYWPPLLTIWHVEPGGADSGEVCKHYAREQLSDGTWHTRVLHGWKWHVHHWRIQVPPLQHLRRRLLTRCAWCGGRSRKGDAVNVSSGGRIERAPWWRGEQGLYHRDCSSIAHAYRTCICDDPVFEHELGGVGYGRCARCGKHRGWRKAGHDAEMEPTRLLSSIPAGQRDPDKVRQAGAMWRRIREREDADR